jgi:DNA-binding NarL/FixJ family response regulator
MFRQGVMACLDDMAVETDYPVDLRAWAHDVDRRVVLLTIQAAADWELLSDLCQLPGTIVIAMLHEADVAGYLRAITAGAACAIPRTVSMTDLRAVFRAAVEGSTLLPTEVVRALATRDAGRSPEAEHPSTREIGWLRDLANGMSVARIAEETGYSERMMFRLLRELYTRLGAANRTRDPAKSITWFGAG